MERFFEFASHHPYLFGAATLLAVAYFFVDQLSGGKKISPQMLGIFQKSHQAVLIDIREPQEFKAGHISGSRNIPFSQLNKHIEELKSTTSPLIYICKMGQTAKSAVQLVQHPNSHVLDGGIYNWQSSGLPLIKS